MTVIIKNFNKKKELIFKVFLGANVLMLVLYVCFLTVVVNEAIGTRQNMQKLQSIGQEYQQLESEYFSILGTMDLDYARSLGFVSRNGKVKYAVRTSAVALK